MKCERPTLKSFQEDYRFTPCDPAEEATMTFPCQLTDGEGTARIVVCASCAAQEPYKSLKPVPLDSPEGRANIALRTKQALTLGV